jgi:phage repressor protein C with HTH and peptisase S24 domain
VAPPATRLRALRIERGLSQARLAELVGVNQTDISKLEAGSRRLTMDWILKLSKALEVAPTDLLPEVNDRDISKRNGELSRLTSPKESAPKLGMFGRHPLPLPPKNLPVRGIAQGGEGGAHILPVEHPPVDFTFRPPVLDDVADAYAVFVWEDSMHPMYKHGQTMWIHPHVPPSPGDGVLIVLDDDSAIVKELVRRTDRAITVRRYNPETEDFEIPRQRVRSIHTIVGVYQGR